MWTAVQVAQSIEKPEQPANIRDYNLEQNEFVKNKKVHLWSYLPGSQRVYQVGNHILNTLSVQPNTQVQTPNIKDDKGNQVVTANVAKALIPKEFETDQNQFFKPPAGITNVSCATEGSTFPHTIKKTTVEFKVHNFSDYERIYTRYFLRPGAQIFVDFGWDTSYLYSPEELLNGGPKKGELKPEDFLYDEKKGFVSNSNGDLETIVGFVTDYNSTAREDGGFDCSVTIVSKNVAIISNPINDFLKKRIEYGLDIEILGLATAGVLGDKYYYNRAKQWSTSDSSITTKKELLEAYERVAEVRLGGDNMLPGVGKGGVEALKWGVYYGGEEGGMNDLYINFGFFEDKLLNKELGFNDLEENETSQAEGNLKSKFNSRNSYMTWNKYIAKAMSNRGNKDCPFLYPEEWGKYNPTYNTLRMMVPDNRQDGTFAPKTEYHPRQSDSNYGKKGTYRYPATKQPEQVNADDTMMDIDKRKNRIPLREIFLKVKTIKEILKSSNTVAQFVQKLCDRINNFSRGLVDLVPSSNDYTASTLAFIDKNIVTDIHSTDVGESVSQRTEFLKKLMTFSPYSPDSIVKEYNLEFAMPQGGLGNMLAVQATSTTDTKAMGVDTMLNGIISMEEVERFAADNTSKDLYVKWLPKIGDEAGRRLRKNLISGGVKTFGFDENDTVFKEIKSPNGYATGNSFEYNGEEQNLAELINNAMKKNTNIDGEKVVDDDPSETVKNESTDDIGDSAEALADENGDVLVSDIFDYYMSIASQVHSNTILPLMEATLTLKIHGVSGFMPGDLITVDYIPEQYYANAFFQVMGITQDVSNDSWSTTLETQMRLLPSMAKLDVSALNLVKIKVDKSNALQTIVPDAEDAGEQERLNLEIRFLDNLTPIAKEDAFGPDKLKDVPNISDVYETSFIFEPYQTVTTMYSYVQLSDVEFYNKLKGRPPKSNKEEKDTPTQGSLIYDINNYTYPDGVKKKIFIEDNGYIYFGDDDVPEDAKSYGGVYDYVYNWHMDKSLMKKGDKVILISSKKKNFYFLPPDRELLKKHAKEINDFFVKGQESYTEPKVPEKDKEKAREYIKSQLEPKVASGQITQEQLDNILEEV